MSKPFKEKVASRKFVLMVTILIVSTIIVCLPLLTPLAPLMTGGEFVSLILGAYGLYVSGNVVQKKFVSLESKGE